MYLNIKLLIVLFAFSLEKLKTKTHFPFYEQPKRFFCNDFRQVFQASMPQKVNQDKAIKHNLSLFLGHTHTHLGTKPGHVFSFVCESIRISTNARGSKPTRCKCIILLLHRLTSYLVPFIRQYERPRISIYRTHIGRIDLCVCFFFCILFWLISSTNRGGEMGHNNICM